MDNKSPLQQTFDSVIRKSLAGNPKSLSVALPQLASFLLTLLLFSSYFFSLPYVRGMTNGCIQSLSSSRPGPLSVGYCWPLQSTFCSFTTRRLCLVTGVSLFPLINVTQILPQFHVMSLEERIYRCFSFGELFILSGFLGTTSLNTRFVF